MKLESEFVIDAPDHQVFDNFLNPDILGPCIPGCESLEQVDETHYSGVLINEVAHVKFRAAFSVTITEMTRPSRVVAEMSGEDNRLASSLKVDATLNVAPRDDGASDVHYTMNVVLWGKLGRMGEAIIRRKTADIEREFVKRFTAACAAGATSATAAPADATLGTAAAPAATAEAPPLRTPTTAAAQAGAAQKTVAATGVTAQPRPAGSATRRAVPAKRSWWQRLFGWFSKKRDAQ